MVTFGILVGKYLNLKKATSLYFPLYSLDYHHYHYIRFNAFLSRLQGLHGFL